MPAEVKATMFFSGGLQGWSETYYLPVDAFTQTNCAAKALPLMISRLDLLPKSISTQGIRCVDATTGFGNRNSFFFFPGVPYLIDGPPPLTFSPTGTFGAGSTVAEDDEFVTVDDALRLRMQDLDGHRRIMLVRGIPASMMLDNETWNPNYPRAVTRIAAFINALLGFNQIRVYNELVYTTIVALVLNPSDFHFINVSAPGLVAADDANVIIKSYKGGYRINGPWRVATAPSNPAVAPYVLGPKRRNVAVAESTLTAALIAPLSYTFSNVTDAAFETPLVYNRRTGRPFGLQAGKRPAR